MKSKANRMIQRDQKLEDIQGEGPNWVLIAGGALLTTLSIRLGCKLKQGLEPTQSRSGFRDNRGSAVRSGSGGCQLHSEFYCFTQDKEGCYYCLSGREIDIKQVVTSPESKESDNSVPLVQIPPRDSDRENPGIMWAPSPDRLELPQKPFHHSHNSSDSPSFSESGSDIYAKREVIQKLRQQLRRRDEMIVEMQSQIMDLRNSLTFEMDHSAHLQSQLDSINQDLYESETEIQRLRKAIADHCMVDSINGKGNGHVADLKVKCVGVEKGRGGDGERVDMLKKEVVDLKEVIEGKEFLLQSYKEQKVELCSKMRELQQRLASQVPNIL